MCEIFIKMKLFSEIPKSASAITLIIANLIPVMGVLFFGWDLFSIMLLYWFETAIIGFFIILKLIVSAFLNNNTLKIKNKTLAGPASKIMVFFIIIFLMFHSSGFMFGHIIFIFVLFGPHNLLLSQPFSVTTINFILGILGKVFIGALMLFFSHGYSFFHNFIERKEYNSTNTGSTIGFLYGRIILMHIVLIASGLFVGLLGAPVIGLIMLVVIKTIVDTIAHIKQHKISV
jgi:hypothetical protein